MPKIRYVAVPEFDLGVRSAGPLEAPATSVLVVPENVVPAGTTLALAEELHQDGGGDAQRRYSGPAAIVHAFGLEACAIPPTPQPAVAVVGALLRARVREVPPRTSLGGGGGFFGEESAAALTLGATASKATTARASTVTPHHDGGGNNDSSGGGGGGGPPRGVNAPLQEDTDASRTSEAPSPGLCIEPAEPPLLHVPRQPSGLLLAHDVGVVGQDWRGLTRFRVEGLRRRA